LGSKHTAKQTVVAGVTCYFLSVAGSLYDFFVGLFLRFIIVRLKSIGTSLEMRRDLPGIPLTATDELITQSANSKVGVFRSVVFSGIHFFNSIDLEQTDACKYS
jgi:hypothetical protein